MQEVFDSLDEYANGNINGISKLIDELTSKSKVNGRSSVVFGNDKVGMYITRGTNGKLEVRQNGGDFAPNKIGQHQVHGDGMIRKDGQMKKNVINSREKLFDLGKEVRSIYPNQTNDLLTAAMTAIKEYAKEHKVSEMNVVEKLKNGTYQLDTSDGLDNPIIRRKMKTIKLNEGQINEIAEVTKLTEYKFYNNVQRFLSDLLKDPVGAKVPFLLQANGIERNQLLYHLKSRGIINRTQKISDKDSQGNPKTARMVVKYNVPKKDFAKKMKKLYIDMVAKNVPEKEKKKEVMNEWSQLEDDLKLANGSPLTMGFVGHPEYKQTDEYAKIMNKRINKDKGIDECDGGASAGTTNCQSSGAFVQPMFGVQRRKMPSEIEEDTTASSVTQNGDISMGVSVPFGTDKETADRTPGFSVERQDEGKRKKILNDKGEEVPKKCKKCGGDVCVTIKGEPVYVCKECGEYYGTMPFPENLKETKIKETKEKRINIDGEEVPYKCSACGGDIVINNRGISGYVCNRCSKEYGVLPMKGFIKGDSIDRMIREAVVREMRKILLTEEYTINKEVDDEANEVYNIICDHKYTEDERINVEGCKEVYQMTLKRDFLGRKITYIVNYYVYNDGVRHNLPCQSSVIDKYGGIVNINYDLESCPMSYGDLHDSIQHELTHVLKQLISYSKKPIYKSRVRNMIPVINDFYCSNDKYAKVIGCVFYMGLNDEQDAYINGLYAGIKNALTNGVQPYEYVRKSELYQKVHELIEIRNNLDSYFSNEEFLKILDLFKQYSNYNKGLNKETFLKKINFTLDRIKKKFLTMIKAYQKFLTRSGIVIHGDIVGLIVQQFLG